LNAAQLVILLVVAFVFAWFFYGIGNSIEQNNAPENNTTMSGGYDTQVGLMGTVGQILPVFLIGLAGWIGYKVILGGGTD
jgi:heme/copper-type cytochrome/quinol oxidase subunit 2